MSCPCGFTIVDGAGRQTLPKVDPTLFSAYDTVGGQTINGSAATVNIDTEVSNTDSAVISLSSDVVTLTLVGGGYFSAKGHFTIGTTGDTDFSYDVFCELAPVATGIYAEIPGSRVSCGEAG